MTPKNCLLRFVRSPMYQLKLLDFRTPHNFLSVLFREHLLTPQRQPSPRPSDMNETTPRPTVTPKNSFLQYISPDVKVLLVCQPPTQPHSSSIYVPSRHNLRR